MSHDNLRNEVPRYVFSVVPTQSAASGSMYWTVEEHPILESSDSWIVVGCDLAPGILKLDRMELDLNGMTVAGDKLFYATRERAQHFIRRWQERTR